MSSSAEKRLRSRPRRDVPTPASNKHMQEQWRLLKALHKLGVLIGMQVLLRESARGESSVGQAVDAFRRADFIVLSSGRGGFVLVAEPCLALSFMFKAAEAGLLSDELEESLDEIVDEETPLRVEDFAEALEPLERVMASIEIIVSPSFGKKN
jgi:hypothetical protein